jgi:hypothetical protein
MPSSDPPSSILPTLLSFPLTLASFHHLHLLFPTGLLTASHNFLTAGIRKSHAFTGLTGALAGIATALTGLAGALVGLLTAITGMM